MKERKRVTTQRRRLSNAHSSPSLRVSEYSVVNSSNYPLTPKIALKSSSWIFLIEANGCSTHSYEQTFSLNFKDGSDTR